MHISELAAAAGIPLPTVKFYIREGLLPKGIPVSATRAEYGDGHRERLRLIGALASIPGLPLSRLRDILDIIDDWEGYGVIEALGTAVGVLPPYAAQIDTVTSPNSTTSADTSPRENLDKGDPSTAADPVPLQDQAPPQLQYARAAVEALGLSFDPHFPATRQLDNAIRAVLHAGLDWSPEIALRYGATLREVAASELAPLPELSSQQAIEYAVLGTALFEPIMLTIRRLLHKDIAEQLIPPTSSSKASEQGH